MFAVLGGLKYVPRRQVTEVLSLIIDNDGKAVRVLCHMVQHID